MKRSAQKTQPQDTQSRLDKEKYMLKPGDANLLLPILHGLARHSLQGTSLTSEQVETQSKQMANDLAAFCVDALSKFGNGQREHGGSITDRDLQAEVRAELLDLFWYTRAMQWTAKKQ